MKKLQVEYQNSPGNFPKTPIYTNTQCEKCGDLNRIPGLEYIGPVYNTFDKTKINEPEVMKVTCRRCGYIAYMSPIQPREETNE